MFDFFLVGNEKQDEEKSDNNLDKGDSCRSSEIDGRVGIYLRNYPTVS